MASCSTMVTTTTTTTTAYCYYYMLLLLVLLLLLGCWSLELLVNWNTAFTVQLNADTVEAKAFGVRTTSDADQQHITVQLLITHIDKRHSNPHIRLLRVRCHCVRSAVSIVADSKCHKQRRLQYSAVLHRKVAFIKITRGQSNLTKSASRGAHSPVRGHPRGSKVVPLNSWGRVSY